MRIILIFIACLNLSAFQENVDSLDITDPVVVIDSTSAKETIEDSLTVEEIKKTKIITASLETGMGLDSLPMWKLDAAFSLIEKINTKFEFLDEKDKDSIMKALFIDELKDDGLSFMLFYDSLQADYAAIIKANRLESILGINITLKSKLDDVPTLNGMGYSVLKYRDRYTEEAILDIALVEALQRSLANAFADSLMFHESDSTFRVYPLPTLVVGGLDYKDNERFLKWKIFDDKVLSSYDAVEVMFEEFYRSNDFVCFDVGTRDTLYTFYKMYGIENYDAPTIYEIRALNDFMVDYYVTGEIERVIEGAKIKIHLCRINDKGLEIQQTVNALLEEDSIVEYRKLLRKSILELLEKHHESQTVGSG